MSIKSNNLENKKKGSNIIVKMNLEKINEYI